jgi:large subunit ribosomal protein L29
VKAVEVHKLNDEEVSVEILRLSRRLFELRGQSVTEKIEDVSQFGKIKKDIARLKTERHARTVSAQGASE